MTTTTEGIHRRKFDELIDRPLLQKDADLLAKLAKRLGIAIEWQHYELADGRWQDGRYQAGDELPPPADDDPIIVEQWPQYEQVELA